MREVLAILAVVLTVACGEERKSDAELQAAVDAYLGQDIGVGAGDAKLGADADVGDAAGLSDGEVGADGASDGSACKGVCGNGACDCGETVASCAVDCKAGPPAGMVLIPAGTFWMGCNAVKDAVCGAKPIEGPQHKVSLSAYYIDITEVTVAEYKKCVDAGSCAAPAGDASSNYCNWDMAAKKPKVGRDQHPVNYLNWAESQKYCNWRGAQAETPADAAKYDLPTEAQWEMAARGSCEKNGSAASDDAGCKAAMRTYPWGEQAATCSFAVMDDGGDGCGAVTTAAVGSKVAGDSPYGIKDMAGNAWEWTRDLYSPSYYADSPGADPWNSTGAQLRVQRGGSFTDDGSTYLRSSARVGATPVGYGASLSFRCVRAYP